MPVLINIKDGSTGRVANIKCDRKRPNGLITYSEELFHKYHFCEDFTNITLGNAMNYNFTASDVVENVHNGIDDVYWTASAISGTWTFNSTTQAHTGTRSINATATVNGNIAQLAKGSMFDPLGYTTLSGWVYLTQWPSTNQNIQIYLYNTSTGATVGSVTNLSTKINTGTLNVWQNFTISMATINPTFAQFDAIRILTVDTGIGNPPDYYLDDIQIQQPGGTSKGIQTYTVEPHGSSWTYIDKISFLFVDNYSPLLSTSTMPNLSYNKILGETLSSGINFLATISGHTNTYSFTIKTLYDLLVKHSKISEAVSDGTNTLLKIDMPTSYILLRSEYNDFLSIELSDDLSGFVAMGVNVSGYYVDTNEFKVIT